MSLLKVIVLEDEEGHPVLSAEVRIGDPPNQANQELSWDGPSRVEYTPIEDVRFSEPRILMIVKELESILRYCRLYREDGKEVGVAGLRLIPKAWVVPFLGSLTDTIGSPSSRCTCHCRFCYIDGNPFHKPKGYNLTVGEVNLRLKYYDPHNKRALFPILREYLEPFANPHLLEILKSMRRAYPQEYLTMITNGSSLTKDVIDSLARLKPINVNISLNTSNPELRTYIMRDKNPEIVLHSFDYLREVGIPFGGSVVAYHDMSLHELEETIRFLDRKGAEGIRIVLPGYTRFHAPNLHFSTQKWWPKVVEVIEKLRKELINFIMLQPNAYWIKSTEPVVDGVLKNSPAHRAGMRPGDRILTINSNVIHSKTQANKMLLENGLQKKRVRLDAERDGGVQSFLLDDNLPLEADYYPYKPVGYKSRLGKNYGISLVGSFRREYLVYLAGILRKHRPKHVVVFISKLIRPQLLEELSKIDQKEYFGDCKVDFEVITPLFWGGNIVLGDLTMVSDYIHHIHRLKEEGHPLDLAIIPSSFLVDWGRDYAGEVFFTIQRKTGVKVELLHCETINQ